MNRGLLIIFPFLAGLALASIAFMLWPTDKLEKTPTLQSKEPLSLPTASSTASSLPAASPISPTVPPPSAASHSSGQSPVVHSQAPVQSVASTFPTSTPSADLTASVVATSQNSGINAEQEVAAVPPTSQPNVGGAIVSTVGPALNVPYGARVPVAFMADDTPRTAQQTEAINKIAEDFGTAVSPNPNDAASSNSPSLSEQEIWDQARQIADNRYRVLFGDDQANRIQMKAALEALQEKAGVPALSSTAAPIPTPAN